MKKDLLKRKPAHYQIDQSGKIEHTNRPTIIALANGKTASVQISAVEKQKLVKMITELRRPNKTYTYDIFAALIYFLLVALAPGEVEIDREYPGHEAGIKERILQFFERAQVRAPEIHFGLVGKRSTAHIHALSVFQKKAQATSIVKSEDIMRILYRGTNKKGWRPQSS